MQPPAKTYKRKPPTGQQRQGTPPPWVVAPPPSVASNKRKATEPPLHTGGTPAPEKKQHIRHPKWREFKAALSLDDVTVLHHLVTTYPDLLTDRSERNNIFKYLPFPLFEGFHIVRNALLEQSPEFQREFMEMQGFELFAPDFLDNETLAAVALEHKDTISDACFLANNYLFYNESCRHAARLRHADILTKIQFPIAPLPANKKLSPYDLLRAATYCEDTDNDGLINLLYNSIENYNDPFIDTIITAIALETLNPEKPLRFFVSQGTNISSLSYNRPFDDYTRGHMCFHDAEHTIRIASNLDPDVFEQVLVHEMIHFVHCIIEGSSQTLPYPSPNTSPLQTRRAKFINTIAATNKPISNANASSYNTEEDKAKRHADGFVHHNIHNRINDASNAQHYPTAESKHAEWAADLGKAHIYMLQNAIAQNKPIKHAMKEKTKQLMDYFMENNAQPLINFIEQHPNRAVLDLDGNDITLLTPRQKQR